MRLTAIKRREEKNPDQHFDQFVANETATKPSILQQIANVPLNS